jgi:hypothetical protein
MTVYFIPSEYFLNSVEVFSNTWIRFFSLTTFFVFSELKAILSFDCCNRKPYVERVIDRDGEIHSKAGREWHVAHINQVFHLPLKKYLLTNRQEVMNNQVRRKIWVARGICLPVESQIKFHKFDINLEIREGKRGRDVGLGGERLEKDLVKCTAGPYYWSKSTAKC